MRGTLILILMAALICCPEAGASEALTVAAKGAVLIDGAAECSSAKTKTRCCRRPPARRS